MKLIAKLSILLLINFVACSPEQEERERQCDAEYEKKVACWRLGPTTRDIERDLNATAETFTGTEDQINSLRSTVRRYCESGSKYYQCLENLTLLPQCNSNDAITTENIKLGDTISKFGMEYACRNDGEAVLKIAANNGIKSLISEATDRAGYQCFTVIRNSDYLVASEGYCRHGDAISDCLLQYTDTLPNKDISGILRDIIPELKVLLNCDGVAATKPQ